VSGQVTSIKAAKCGGRGICGTPNSLVEYQIREDVAALEIGDDLGGISKVATIVNYSSFAQ
jgi:hypothetical protein